MRAFEQQDYNFIRDLRRETNYNQRLKPIFAILEDDLEIDIRQLYPYKTIPEVDVIALQCFADAFDKHREKCFDLSTPFIFKLKSLIGEIVKLINKDLNQQKHLLN